MDGSTMPDPQRGRTEAGDIDPAAIAREIEDAGRAWADMRATCKLLDLAVPQVRGAVIQELLDLGTTSSGRRMTRRDAEELAMQDTRYIEAVETAIDGRRKANIAEAVYKAVQARFEAMRTAEATRRAEMNLSRY